MGISIIGGGGGGGSAELTTAQKQSLPPSVIPNAQLPAGDRVGFRMVIPSGYKMQVWRGGVIDNSGNAPAAVHLQVRDSGGVAIINISSTDTTGTPIGSISTAGVYNVVVINNTAGQKNLSGHITYTIEAV